MCYHLQSSTNFKGDDSETDRGRSLTCKMNSRDLRIIFYETPDVIGCKEKDTPSLDLS